MKARIMVQNLKCSGCAKTIHKKLSSIQRITEVNVEPHTSTISFVYENMSDQLLVIETLTELGYPTIDSTNNLSTKAKSYISCAVGKLSK